MTTAALTAQRLRKLCQQAAPGVGQPIRPKQAATLALALGPLAGWWMQPEALDAAETDSACGSGIRERRAYPARLSDQRGGCTVFFALEDDALKFALREGLALPLMWLDSTANPPQTGSTPSAGEGAGDGHDPRLPAGLRALADDVVKRVLPQTERGNPPPLDVALGRARGPAWCRGNRPQRAGRCTPLRLGLGAAGRGTATRPRGVSPPA